MAGKSKFNISRSLDDKIKKLICCNEENDSESAKLLEVSILGFHYSNVTNYIGLTSDYKKHNTIYPTIGYVFIKEQPDESQISAILKPIREYTFSLDNYGSHDNSDKNEHLYLIYYQDKESKVAERKIFDSNICHFLEEQPKLSVLDDAKVYNHSALVRLNVTLSLKLFDNSEMMLPANKESIISSLDNVKKMLSNESKGISIYLDKSNFSSKTPLRDDKNMLESLYTHLEAPSDLLQMNDYLPQLSKSDKEKMVDKWRNKVKDQRAPLNIRLEHEDLSDADSQSIDSGHYKLDLEEFLYLQANDSIAKSTKILLFALRQKLNLLEQILIDRAGTILEPGELKSCTFKPFGLNHLVQSIYPIGTKPDYGYLKRLRQEIHVAYLIPLDKPEVRYSQRITNARLTNADEDKGYLCNVHADIWDKSGIKGGIRNIVSGKYTYHHYLQDRAQDNGWGCAYRSLQTIVSWFKHQGFINSPDVEIRSPRATADGGDGNDKISSLRKKLHDEARVPTHSEIQSVLVDVGDKQPSFVGSQKWIGSQEVCYVLNHLYSLDSKFISVSSGSELVYKARDLGQHFATQSTPVMIGGGVLAHTIIGVDFNEKNGDISYLILDPHYTGAEDLPTITKKGWCGWKKNSFWDKSAFYNLCLPQKPIEF